MNQENAGKQSIDDLGTNTQPSSSRRKLLLSGGAGSVLLSVKSGSALAGGVCVSPSAYSSIKISTHASRTPGAFPNCSSHGIYGAPGLSDTTRAGRWNPVDPLTATLSAPGTMPSPFSTIPSPFSGTTKLLEVLQAGGSTANSRDLVTLYLDVRTGRSGAFITLDDVADMWAICFGGTVTQPLYTTWTIADVRGFLDITVGNSTLP